MFTGRHSSYYGDWYDCPIFQLSGKLFELSPASNFAQGNPYLGTIKL